MMKKRNSKAMALVMAATLMFAAVPVEADATTLGTGEHEGQGEVEVSYTNESVLEDPAVPGIVVKIPANINFTEDVREVDADVTLESTNEDYDVTKYAREATVSVESEKGYKLTNDASTDELEYKLFYDKAGTGSYAALTVAAATSEEIGTLGGYEESSSTNARTLIEGKAVLGADQTPSQVGKYTDKLTYKVSFTGTQDMGALGI